MKKYSKSEKTRHTIAMALYKLLQTRSFEEITVSDITNEAGINRVTFYYYFEDKYQLLSKVVEYLSSYIDIEFSEQPTKESVINSIKNIANSFMQDCINNSEFFKKINRKGNDLLITILLSQCKNRIIKTLTTYRNILQLKISPEFLGDFLTNGYSQVLSNWIKSPKNSSPEEFKKNIDTIIDLLLS